MIQITDRDVAIMRWMLEQKFMHAKQLRSVFWKDAKDDCKEVYRRLGKLEKAGFIKRSNQDIYKYLLYVVTKKGYRVLKGMGSDNGLTVLNNVDYTTYRHDLGITDLRVWFYRQGYTEWISERVIVKQYDLKNLPDGMIYHGGKYLAIEYETVRKAKERYRKIAFDYEFYDYFSDVLYVVRDARLKTKLEELLKECEKIHFVTTEALMSLQSIDELPKMNFFAREG